VQGGLALRAGWRQRRKVFDGEQRLAVQRGQELQAGVDGMKLQLAARIEFASTTVQAPQSPSLQPSLVPVWWRFSRSQSSSVRVVCTPLTSTVRPPK